MWAIFTTTFTPTDHHVVDEVPDISEGIAVLIGSFAIIIFSATVLCAYKIIRYMYGRNLEQIGKNTYHFAGNHAVIELS